jgi:hypothetical protein
VLQLAFVARSSDGQRAALPRLPAFSKDADYLLNRDRTQWHAMSEHGAERRIVLAGVAGNILEWYDFSVYGFFAVAIARNYFPSKNPTTSLIEAFGVFGAGFLMRPGRSAAVWLPGRSTRARDSVDSLGHGDGGADIFLSVSCLVISKLESAPQ